MKFRNLMIVSSLLVNLVVASFSQTQTQRSANTNSNIPVSVGDLHNAGVQYVLEQIKTVPRLDEVGPLVGRLTSEFCNIHHLACQSENRRVIPLNPEKLLAQTQGSKAFKDEIRSLISMVQHLTAGPRVTREVLEEYQRSLKGLETSAAQLSPEERAKLSDAVSVARSSAILWAPKEAGGLDGKNFLHVRGTVHGSPMEFDEDPILWDLAGMGTCGIGCAIGASVACILLNSWI